VFLNYTLQTFLDRVRLSGLLILPVVVALLAACTAAPVLPPSATPRVAISASAPPPVGRTTLPPVSPTPAPATATQAAPVTATAAASAVPTLASPPGPTETLGPTTEGRAENFTLLGRDALEGRGWNAGLALDYPCAYIGSRQQPLVAIVDVSDPAQPQTAGQLSLAPGLQPVELRALPELGLLVVMNFSPVVSLLTFDVHDCRAPRPLGSLSLGAAPHEFYLWLDPAQPGRLLAFVAMWAHQKPDLQVVDLSDPAAPRVSGRWSAPASAGTLHSLSLSPDGHTAYLAMWEGGFDLADASDFALARPAPSLRLLNPGAGLLPPPRVNVHSAVPLADPNYVLLTQEYYACPFAGLAVADVHDPAHPALAGAFSLPENLDPCGGLPQADAVFTSHNPLVAGALAFVSWYGGGLEAFDLSTPSRPARVGLFVPDGAGPLGGSPYGSYAVQVWSYPILRGGLIYVSDIRAGLFILRYTGPGAEALNKIVLAQGNAN
jgi:hypothetical protein